MSSQTVLIIEDDADIVELLKYNLERERYQVIVAETGEDGLKAAQAAIPNLILLDLGLPGIQGLDVCRLLKDREATASVPVIILTAREEESDVVVGLEMGADDYVTKPFKIRELVARVRAVLRRAAAAGQTEESSILKVGGLEIDSERHEVKIDGEPATFTLAEFRILRALASNVGRVMTREQLVTAITGGSTYIIDRNVDVHIRAIRKRLGSARDLIYTVRGVGYRMEQPLT